MHCRSFHAQVFRYLALLVVVLYPTGPLVAQAVTVPIRHEVYEFIKKMEGKQVVRDVHDIVRPLTRLDVARLLKEIGAHSDQLSSVDLRRLTFLQEEFGEELGMVDSSWSVAPRRWHLFSTDIRGGSINADLLLAYGKEWFDRKAKTKTSNGFRAYGYAFGVLGYSFTFADNKESGQLLDRRHLLSPEDGIAGYGKRGPDFFEYDFTYVELTYAWKWLTLSLERIPQSWATGRRGSLSFSTKAPPASQFRLRADLADWITLTYIHGELNSTILDSSRSYHTYSSPSFDYYRPVYRQKYIAAHMIELSPFTGVDIALGESIVYSDRNPSLTYLIPVMFFKSGEHYNNDTDNSQFHISIDINLIPGITFYGSSIIDEIALSGLFDPAKQRNQLGFTLGFQTYDLPLNDLEWIVEFTKIYPWVYSHKYPAVTFTNNGYDMGHWIGQNADNIYTEIIYRPFRTLRASLWVERFRKGGFNDVALQYQIPSQPFLYGPVRRETSIGFSARYEPVRDLFIDLRFRSFKLSDEATPALDHAMKPEVILQAQYGVW